MKLLNLLPLIGVVLGWTLNELSQYIRIRRDQRTILCQSLNALIDLRFAISRRVSYFSAVASAGKISSVGQDVLKDFVNDKRVSSDTIKDKIIKSCALLQNIAPLEAYEIENKTGSIFDLMEVNHNRINSRDITIDDVNLELQTMNVMLKCLDYDIKQLSKRYSLLFSLKYKKYVKRADKGLPGGFEKIFELI
jgi:hypothetical protein